MFVVGQEVTVELVTGSTDNLDGAIAMNAFLQCTNRRQRRRTANVARTIISVGYAQRTLTRLLPQTLVVRQIVVIIAVGIAKAMHHHDLTAINPLPQS